MKIPIDETAERTLTRLHNRHLAKLLTKLEEIKTAQIVIEAVKNEMSRYTTDIKEQVLKSNELEYDKRKNY